MRGTVDITSRCFGLCILNPSQLVIRINLLWTHLLLLLTMFNMLWNVITVILAFYFNSLQNVLCFVYVHFVKFVDHTESQN